MLLEAPDHRLKKCDVASVLRLSRSGRKRRMEGVVKARYVARERDETDGRVAFVLLTPKGFDLLKRVVPEHLKSVRRPMIN